MPDRRKITDELFAAAESGDLETVKDLLTKHPEMKTATTRGGSTLLHLAFDSRALIEYLIAIGADIEARNDSRWAPLHSQAYRGNKAGVELLLEHGADIEARDFYGHTPLLSSIRWDRVDVTRFLIERGADINAADVLGRTALITSAIEGHVELAKVLLEAKADIHLKDTIYHRTALHFAALNGRLKIVAELLKKGAAANEKDAAGKTPLDYAGRYGHEKVAQVLTSSGAEGEIDARSFGHSPRLKESLKDGQAYAWYMGEIGYAVKTANHFLLFSYATARGDLPDEPRLSNGHIDLDEIAACDTMVFAGEAHWRQHNPERYNSWQKTHKSMSFIYSFEDKLGRNRHYFKDVEGPEYIHLPDGEQKTIHGVKVKTIPVTRGSGFLVETDGLLIFSGGHHLLGDESQKEAFNRTIDDLKGTGRMIDLLILPGYFLYGRILPGNLEGVEYAVRTLKPRAFLASGSGPSTEFVLAEVSAALEKYKNRTNIFCPEHRGDMFILKDRTGGVTRAVSGDTDDLAAILEGCAGYCDKLGRAGLDFICHEIVREEYYQGSSAELKINRPRTSLDNSPLPPKVYEYEYDYQLIRKDGQIVETRTLLKENGKARNVKSAALKTRHFYSTRSVFGPVGILGREQQGRYDFKIIGRENIDDRDVIVIEAKPKKKSTDNPNFGRFWIEAKDFGVRRYVVEQESLAGFQRPPNPRIIPQYLVTHYYDFEKNGLRFPSKTVFLENYVSRGSMGQNPMKVSETTFTFSDYKFFLVDVSVEIK